ncbi:hypothetical protein DUZ99_14690 [Xylanibacillus composti]|uniref:t-SNARE coiled-coil homology domain-containing protein n=1 Tax=Xylanibacillus composti TaxID=1572762 RepID=A0A8J4M228_9BACL|nr:hypothetical protein [Xylanibacillus composti]MDT9726226.1 hypothetical protein [Xylanibacillus composti]GIQ68076.1 hypothetical protein XYCOK13_09000 [Xylanibacillus composti]
MSEQKLNQIEQMLSDLIHSVGTLKVFFEEEKEENQRRFEQIDKRFEQIDKRFEQIDRRFEQIDKRFEQIDRRFEHVDNRFDEMLAELRVNKVEHDYMATRLFRAEMELDNLKEQLAKK